MLFDIVDGVADSCNLLGILVRNLKVESLFEFHNQLYGIQRVGTECAGETCFRNYFRLLNSQFVDNDLNDLFLNLKNQL